MGIENRDYTRDGDYTGTLAGWGLEYVSPIVKWLIGINIAVFLLQIFLTRSPSPADIEDLWRQQPPPMQAMYREQERFEAGGKDEEKPPSTTNKGAPQEPVIASAQSDQTPPPSFVASVATERVSIIDEWFALRTSKVIRGQVWRLVTYAFCHSRGELFHILLNMLGLFWFGITLESMYGGKEFLLFYLTAAVVAGLASIGLDVWLGWDLPTVGASGAVMAVLVLYAIHYPRNTIRFFWFFRSKSAGSCSCICSLICIRCCSPWVATRCTTTASATRPIWAAWPLASSIGS
jgi:membrane associated rhomboid family serine protease